MIERREGPAKKEGHLSLLGDLTRTSVAPEGRRLSKQREPVSRAGWKQIHERYAERSCQEYQFGISDPSIVRLNLCDRVSADVPAEALTFSGELRLR